MNENKFMPFYEWALSKERTDNEIMDYPTMRDILMLKDFLAVFAEQAKIDYSTAFIDGGVPEATVEDMIPMKVRREILKTMSRMMPLIENADISWKG